MPPYSSTCLASAAVTVSNTLPCAFITTPPVYNSCCPEGYATKSQALSNTRSSRHVSKGCKASVMQLANRLTQLASTFDLQFLYDAKEEPQPINDEDINGKIKAFTYTTLNNELLINSIPPFCLILSGGWKRPPTAFLRVSTRICHSKQKNDIPATWIDHHSIPTKEHSHPDNYHPVGFSNKNSEEHC